MGGERGVWIFISYVGQGGESAFAPFAMAI